MSVCESRHFCSALTRAEKRPNREWTPTNANIICSNSRPLASIRDPCPYELPGDRAGCRDSVAGASLPYKRKEKARLLFNITPAILQRH